MNDPKPVNFHANQLKAKNVQKKLLTIFAESSIIEV